MTRVDDVYVWATPPGAVEHTCSRAELTAAKAKRKTSAPKADVLWAVASHKGWRWTDFGASIRLADIIHDVFPSACLTPQLFGKVSDLDKVGRYVRASAKDSRGDLMPLSW
jgi:hypothetical protein